MVFDEIRACKKLFLINRHDDKLMERGKILVRAKNLVVFSLALFKNKSLATPISHKLVAFAPVKMVIKSLARFAIHPTCFHKRASGRRSVSRYGNVRSVPNKSPYRDVNWGAHSVICRSTLRLGEVELML